MSPLFKEEETGPQNSQGTCSRTHSKQGLKPWLESLGCYSHSPLPRAIFVSVCVCVCFNLVFIVGSIADAPHPPTLCVLRDSLYLGQRDLLPVP